MATVTPAMGARAVSSISNAREGVTIMAMAPLCATGDGPKGVDCDNLGVTGPESINHTITDVVGNVNTGL